jgi:hypothetical protein
VTYRQNRIHGVSSTKEESQESIGSGAHATGGRHVYNILITYPKWRDIRETELREFGKDLSSERNSQSVVVGSFLIRNGDKNHGVEAVEGLIALSIRPRSIGFRDSTLTVEALSPTPPVIIAPH